MEALKEPPLPQFPSLQCRGMGSFKDQRRAPLGRIRGHGGQQHAGASGIKTWLPQPQGENMYIEQSLGTTNGYRNKEIQLAVKRQALLVHNNFWYSLFISVLLHFTFTCWTINTVCNTTLCKQ
uniref:Uncharacterized protein n=1 Tax=Anguilla anguilla TaxID=7936 RepID=A0A0E9X1U3_ANGAN